MQKSTQNLLLACALFVSAGAQALQMSTYLGAARGAAHWNANCDGTTDCKKNPAAYRVYGGYNFSPNLGL